MDAEHAARHLSGAAGFAAEAGRIGRKLDGKILRLKNVVAIEVGDRDFGRRDEPEVVDLAVIKIFGELRKLARTGHRGGVHDKGRKHLGIALGLAVDIKHILDERTLKLSALAQKNRKARTRKLNAAREIKETELLADSDVIKNRVLWILPLADGLYADVGGAVHAGRNLVGRNVGDHKQRVAKIGLNLSEFAINLGDTVADLTHLPLGCGDITALLGDLTDFLRGGIALRLQSLGLRDKGAALLVETPGLLQDVLLDAAARELGGC